MKFETSDVASSGSSANLTPDPTGIGGYTEGIFRGVLRSGHGGTLHPAMPWVAYRHLTDADIGAIYENGSSILSGSTSFIKSVKLSVSNGLRGQKALGVFGNAGVGNGGFEVSGTMELYVENATYYNKWLNGTNTSLSVGMADAAGNGYLFDFDKIMFTDGGLNASGRDDVMLSLPFEAFYNAGTNRGIRITRAVAA